MYSVESCEATLAVEPAERGEALDCTTLLVDWLPLFVWELCRALSPLRRKDPCMPDTVHLALHLTGVWLQPVVLH